MTDSATRTKPLHSVVDSPPTEVNETRFVQTVKNLLNSPAKEKKRTPPKRGQVGRSNKGLSRLTGGADPDSAT